MAMVVRVRFKRASKLYDFDPNGLELHTGMSVVTETARGVELGECMSGVMDVPDERLISPLKPIIRIATEQDLLTQKRNEESEKEAFDIAIERIAEHKLEMKLVDVEYAFDHSKIIFYFTANGRVDFRMLVKNLASIFKTRIELRQIGVRDEAKMLGGIGPCGRPICCRTFLSDFTPVSIKMAKEQNLSLNPTKISGLCDRLMCCLKYEQDQYEVTRKRMPRVGRELITPDGVGTINAINVLEETVRVRIAVGDSFELREYPIDACQRPEPSSVPAADKADKPARADKAERPEKGDKADKPEKGERREKAERPPRAEKGERPRKAEGDKPRRERTEKAERPEKGDRAEQRPEKGERVQKRAGDKRPPREQSAAPAVPGTQKVQPAPEQPAQKAQPESVAPEAQRIQPAPEPPVQAEAAAPQGEVIEEEMLQIVENAGAEDLL